MDKRLKNIHFVGIGGIGMSGIAEIMLNLGYQVSGSDLKESPITRRLASLGATIHYKHRVENLGQAQVVVYSSAVKPDNPELVAARERLVPLVARGEMLAELMRMKYGIAVAGSHGKTTTTSLIAAILAHGGLDPTAVIGGRVKAFGSNAKLGQSQYLVAEADESDGTFLRLSPTIVVVTNVDPEHMDHYRDLAHLETTFQEFIHLIPFYGLAVLCWDHPRVRKLAQGYRRRYIAYGLNEEAKVSAQDIVTAGFQTSFIPTFQGEKLGHLTLNIPGLHNVANCLAALAVARELEIDFSKIKEAVEGFEGVERRFQVKGKINGITIVDDYGHHPEEIKATLQAAKAGASQRLVVLFQPHRYTRLASLFEDFLTAFSGADLLLINEIYPAGEEPIPGMDGKRLAEGLKAQGHPAVSYHPTKEEMVEAALQVVQPRDLVITLGAGDIWMVAEELTRRLGS